MTPTPEQAAIADAVAAGQPLKVLALAGTGKTTTLAWAAQRLRGRRVLYLAFNRSVAQDAQRRFPPWVHVSTAHGLAFRTVGHAYRARLVPNLLALRPHIPAAWLRPLHRPGDRDPYPALMACLQTLEAFLHSADPAPGPQHVPPLVLWRLPPRQRAAYAAAAARAAGAVWDRCRDPAGTWPVTHDVYLKVWQLSAPRLPYDTILFDEAQDADPAMTAVLTAQASQVVAVGDPHQAIYGWRGAHDALSRLPWPTLPLTVSWRFGPALAAPANRILHLVGERHRLTGAGPTTGPVRTRAILGRTNAGLIEEADHLLRHGTRPAIAGGVEPLVALLLAVHALHQGRPSHHPDLVWFTNWAEVVAAADTPLGAPLQPLVRLVQRHGADLPALAARLRAGVVPEDQATVVCSTTHRAKGREWDQVRLLGDFRWPRHVADAEEAHLLYVALTRARHALDARAIDPLLDHAQPLSLAVPS